MAGVGSHSTKQTLEFIEDAAAAGADYVLCLPPAYFGKALKLQQVIALAEGPCKLRIAAKKYGAAISSAKAAGIENAAKKLWPRKPYAGPTKAIKLQVAEALSKVKNMTF
jgi:4-hydroxy-2-oxoglutarate aldolase